MPRRTASAARGDHLSPVLLLGAGSGEASSGLLYLAGHLRRNGVEAWVRLVDTDATEDELGRSLERLMAHVRPRLVGLSLKWFHHLHRGLWMAAALKRIDPGVRVVLGGNTATRYWRELLASPQVDDVVLGDGEAPLLALCRGAHEVPNHAARDADGTPRRTPLSYVQGADGPDAHYSHFDELFLSRLDLASFSGWIAPGKGCAEACLYCGGGRGVQAADFGRPLPFLRPVASVRRDHQAVLPHTWQLRFDFPGGDARYLEAVWRGLDLSRHASTYFLWGAPPPELVDLLAATFERVFLVLDVGCFSATQRAELGRRGLLKPCPSDEALLEAVSRCRRHRNLELEVCGIAGLPLATAQTLAEEAAAVERLLGLGVKVGYQRLEAQPGATVTEHARRFEMVAEAHDFGGFLQWLERADFSRPAVPMVRFADASLERRVARQVARLQRGVADAGPRPPTVRRGTPRLRAQLAARAEVELGAWLGDWRVPSKLRKEKATVLRAPGGAGLTCAPSLDPAALDAPSVEAGPHGEALLAVLDTLASPGTLGEVGHRLRHRLEPEDTQGLLEALLAAGFLTVA